MNIQPIRTYFGAPIPLLIIVLLASLSGSVLAQPANAKDFVNWDKVSATFLNYKIDPTAEKAKAFLDTLPKGKSQNEMGDAHRAVGNIYNNLAMIRDKVWSGDKIMAEAAFRLLSYADGGFAEELYMTLGELVGTHPNLFIELLYQYKDDPAINVNGYSLVLSVYGIWDDSATALVPVWEKRIKSLDGVSDQKYSRIRDVCIATLREEISRVVEKRNAQERAAANNEVIDWDKIREAFAAYYKEPSPENAQEVLGTLPKYVTYHMRGSAATAIIEITDHISIAKSGALSGNRDLVEAVFRLFNCREAFSRDQSSRMAATSQMLSGDLEEIVGTIVEKNPTLFLDVFREYQTSWLLGEYGSPLLKTVHTLANRQGMIAELEARVKALEGVRASRYAEIRDQCLAQLNGAIETIKRISK